MLTMSKAMRRMLVAAALTVGVASMASAAEQGQWWCYNGTCCSYHNGAVTQPCMYDCDTGDGAHWSISCSGA